LLPLIQEKQSLIAIKESLVSEKKVLEDENAHWKARVQQLLGNLFI